MSDVVYVCRKCSYTQTVKEGQIVTAQVPTHCGQVMTGETTSFKDGLGSGWHYYQERKDRKTLDTVTETALTYHARYILSIKVYPVVPREWIDGFMTGWEIAKEVAERKNKVG